MFKVLNIDPDHLTIKTDEEFLDVLNNKSMYSNTVIDASSSCNTRNQKALDSSRAYLKRYGLFSGRRPRSSQASTQPNVRTTANSDIERTNTIPESVRPCSSHAIMSDKKYEQKFIQAQRTFHNERRKKSYQRIHEFLNRFSQQNQVNIDLNKSPLRVPAQTIGQYTKES